MKLDPPTDQHHHQHQQQQQQQQASVALLQQPVIYVKLYSRPFTDIYIDTVGRVGDRPWIIATVMYSILYQPK